MCELVIKQEFNPSIVVCLEENDNPKVIKKRYWGLTEKDYIPKEAQPMGYPGQYQIEEVWKHYYKNIFVSNYGYVVIIKDEYKATAEKVFCGELLENLQSDNGVRWLDLSKTAQKLIFDNSFVPFNRKGSGCKICLNITGNTAEYDVHRIIAKKFLKQEDGADTVHHIDNNSYNNAVTNLMWLSKKEHDRNGFRAYHPMSKK